MGDYWNGCPNCGSSDLGRGPDHDGHQTVVCMECGALVTYIDPPTSGRSTTGEGPE